MPNAHQLQCMCECVRLLMPFNMRMFPINLYIPVHVHDPSTYSANMHKCTQSQLIGFITKILELANNVGEAIVAGTSVAHG